MDYVVGSVAALITGNVTPNRPKLVRRALTPTKHQPSPNVTPKSEFVEDRSIFLSPTLQKKKAIVKKSPKRIFQNPDLDSTENEETSSPKADKVKKHLKDDLESDIMGKSKKSPNKKQIKSLETPLETHDNSQVTTEGSPKKKKKRNSESNFSIESSADALTTTEEVHTTVQTSKKKKQKKSQANNKNTEEIPISSETVDNNTITEQINNKKTKHNKNQKTNVTDKENQSIVASAKSNKKKRKKNKNKNLQIQQTELNTEGIQKSNNMESNITEPKKKSKKKKDKQSKTTEKTIDKESTTEMDMDNTENSETEEVSTTANPNAITEQDSDSEHESDNEIESENEETNKQLLENEQADESTDEEDDVKEEKKEKKGKKEKKEKTVIQEKEVDIEEEIKRTIFVGNVPLSQKTRKEIKKIFRPHGEIETVRIRFVPVKDARVTPKVAVIKNELHPERTTVNVYVKFADPASVEKALAENNTVLNGNHLRVTRSGSTGSEHDPHLAVFVGNLPFGIEDETFRSQFEKCGEIESVRIIRDKKTNAGKGFGYVNFTSKDGVELALNLSEEDLTIKNRILRVKRCTQTLGRPKKPGNRPGGMNRGEENRQGGMNRGGQGRPGQNRPGGFNRGGDNRQGGFNRGGQNRPQGFNRGGENRPGGFNKGGENRPGGFNRGGENRPGGFNRGGVNRPGGFNKGGENRPGGFNKGGDNKPGGMNRSEEGAHRRIMNKRKFQENSDGPPNKRQKNLNQPGKEKKQRKEFVGMTSEKKKKQKFNKGQKKKKVLSEILTKKKS